MTCASIKKRELLILIGTIFICLVGIEMGLRYFPFFAKRSGVFEPQSNRKNLSDIVTVFEPNYTGKHIARDFKVDIRANSLGFREREIDFDKMSLERPLLFLGDSYFFGWGVERELRFSERLSKTPQFQLPIVNLSFPGQGTSHYFDMLNMYAKKLNPRQIIIGFFVGNDFLDDQNALRIRTNDTKKQFFAGSFRKFVRESRVINVVKYSLWSIPWFRDVFNKAELRNERINLFCDGNKKNQNLLYSTTFSMLNKISEFSNNNHIPILIIIIPDHLQVIDTGVFEECDIYNPQKKLTEFLKKIELPYLDILPYFQNSKEPELYYFREDKHWTPEGHEFIRKIIIEHLSIHDSAGLPVPLPK